MDNEKNKIEITPMAIEDIEEIDEIEKLSFSDPWSAETIADELNYSFAVYYSAKIKGETVGFGGLHHVLEDATVTTIAVHPKFRCMGVGDIIISAFKDYCAANGVSRLSLEVRKSNLAAQGLYFKHGFIIEGERPGYYIKPREDAYICSLYF